LLLAVVGIRYYTARTQYKLIRFPREIKVILVGFNCYWLSWYLSIGTLQVAKLRHERMVTTTSTSKSKSSSTSTSTFYILYTYNNILAKKFPSDFCVSLCCYKRNLLQRMISLKGGLNQFKFYFVFTGWDHIEHQPACHNR
jgi:hypothetical protein